MSLVSKVAEKMFDFLLSLAGYENLSGSFDKEELLQKAEVVRSGRVANIERKRSEAGLTTRWSMLSSSRVLDLVYGLDCVIAPAGPNGVKFGFDVTLNPDEVAAKVAKLKEFAPLWKSVGINKCAVVLLVPPAEFGIGVLSEDEKEGLVEQLLEGVIYALDEQTVEVRSYVLAW